MRSHLASDPQDSSGDLGNGDMNFGPTAFGPFSSFGGGTPASSTPPLPVAPVLPDESVEAIAAVSGSGSGGVGSVIAETSSSGFTINLLFDAAAMAAPASFRTGIEQATAILSATITNKITVNINIDYSGTGGGAFAGPTTGEFANYSTVRADLIADAAPGDTSFNALPTGSTIQGQSSVAVWNAQLKLFGLLSPTATAADGSASFATDINSNLLVGVALHELTHAMGRVPYGEPDGAQPDIFDFYRFTSPGARLFTDNIPASSAYFSLDGGNTKIADFGVSSDPSDFLNSGVQGENDPFNEFYSGSTLQSLTTVDKEMLDALGFNTLPFGLAVVANTTDALQGGAALALLSGPPGINDPGSATLTSATITIANASGNPVTGDELFVNGIQNGALDRFLSASWNATTDTLTLSGTATISAYETLLSEITFQDTGTDASSGSHPVRTVTWTINDGTNSYSATSTIDVDRAPVAANNTATDAVGSTLTTTAASGVLSNASDLDSDSLTVTGVSDTANGAGTIGSSLAGLYGYLTLNANGSYSYVADSTAAISSGPTGSHLQDTFNYTVSDGNGGTTNASLTITLDRAPVVTASNVVLTAGHTTVAASSLFSAADPDGNAIATYAFEDTGSGHFVLNGVVEPNNQEIDVSAAQLSQLTYQGVAGSTTDTVEIRVNDGTLWSSWQSFTVTPPPGLIEAHGVTALLQSGNDYFLNPVASGTTITGPELMFNGAPVTAGEWTGWAPVGAEHTTNGGYDVAFYNSSTGLFNIWSTDSNGNYITNLASGISGTSSTLENFENVFQQDLNNDGTIGPPPPPPPSVIEAHGVTALLQSGNDYFLNPVASGTGPELMFSGAPVTAGEWTGWAPVGAEHTTNGGYDVAFYNASTGLFNIWSTDNNGNYITNLASGISGTSSTLENFETVFQQDLNGDGTIGPPPPPPPTVIEAHGVTALLQSGNDYFLNPVASGTTITGPELMFNGAPVTAGEWTGWTPIGAEHTSSGYEVAFYNASSGLFNIWSTDANGNYIANLASGISATSTTLENFENIFHQDLNNDGSIGPPPPPPPTTIESHGVTALLQSGSDYFLNPVSSGTTITGPELMFSGAPVATGEWTGWAPVGAEATSSGYDVAFYNASTGLFNIWSTDNNGNYITNLASGISGTSSTLENFETVFHQDLNGDGTMGPPPPPPPTTIEAHGVTALLQSGSDYFLNPVSSGTAITGPELFYSGTPVTAGECDWLGAGRRRAHLKRIRCRLLQRLHWALQHLEHRQQWQLHHQSRQWHCGHQFDAGELRDDLRPGPQP